MMALDAGTTSNRCILFDRQGRMCSVAQREFPQYYPAPGYVEHDAREIWDTQLAVAREAMERIGAAPADIAAVGITNQRETTIVWDRRTGELLFGTVDTWLVYRLTGGRVHATDYSNASRTMLFNIHSLQWDDDLLREMGIPRCMLPEVRPSAGSFGETDPQWFGAPIPIAGVAGDQQAALFGQTCFAPGEAKNTYGTGCFLLMNTGETPTASPNGLVTTIAWGIDGRVQYALEGSVFIAGAAIQWLRDEMGLIGSAAESETCARRVPDTAGCFVVPAFVGLGAPHWDQYARGCIVGLTRGVTRDHIVRATLESLAYQTADVLRVMEEDAHIRLCALRVDGGACANDFLMQFQADIIGAPVLRPACAETTALGAAYLAGLAVGFWSGQNALRQNAGTPRVFEPAMGDAERSERLYGWNKAVRCSFGWAHA